MKLTYYNYKQLGKELTKGKGLTRTTSKLFESVMFWALQHNDVKDTVTVNGKTADCLYDLQKAGLVRVFRDYKYYGAELLGSWELDNTWNG